MASLTSTRFLQVVYKKVVLDCSKVKKVQHWVFDTKES